MDVLKCNILTCRSAVTDKAVVTTCSHIFCVECANSQFNESRLCPACETSLTEPDDVVVCSLHPTNDYKTSVLSGLNPAIVLEICSRAMSFWQYQMHQELSFQQTVLRTVNDKSAFLQKELDNAVREARGQISLLNNKLGETERDLDLERRKTTSLQESLREREKEYQKLKAQFDKIKRKALLAPGVTNEPQPVQPSYAKAGIERHAFGEHHISKLSSHNVPVDVGAVVGDMTANGIQRTPIASRTVKNNNRLVGRLPAQTQGQYPNPNSRNRGFDNANHSTVSEYSEEDYNHTITGDVPRHPARNNGWHPGTQNRQVSVDQHEGFIPHMQQPRRFKPVPMA